MKWLSVLVQELRVPDRGSHAELRDSAPVCTDCRGQKEISAFQVKSYQANQKQACENRCQLSRSPSIWERALTRRDTTVQASFCFRNPCRCKRSPGAMGHGGSGTVCFVLQGSAKQLLLLRFRLPCRGSSTTWFQRLATLKIPPFLVCLLNRRFLDRMTSSNPDARVHRSMNVIRRCWYC
jgi:hypothetical protein